MKLWYRISPAAKLVAICIALFAATLFFSEVLDLSPVEAALAASGVAMATMFFGYFHIKQSQEIAEQRLRQHDEANPVKVRKRRRRKKNGSWDDNNWQ